MIPFLKVKGIRQRWLLNSISILVMILVVVVAAFSLIIKNYYDSSILTDMESKARMAASYFSTEASSYNYNSSGDYLTAAQDYVSSFEDGTRIELQFLNPGGKVIYSSNGLTLSGTMPGTGDITQVQSYQEVATWKGVSSQTGERITAVSAPLLYNGELVGIMRYVTSMRLVDRQVLVMTLVAVILSVSILILVYISNIYFVRSIVDPVKNITGIARRIAGGSYGIQVEKKFDDEVGDLTDAINDMSLRIKQAESMKSEFISSVSHELRTPLTAIKGWAETLHEGADPDTTEKGMNVIIRESERLSGLVEELLDFSRLQNNRMRLMVSRLDILAELDEAVYMFTDRARTEEKQLNYEETTALPPVYGDVDRLRQVFVNIIDNALKYTSPGGTITVSSREDSGWVRVVISDTGCGIPAEHLPNVKKKFYKANQLVRGSGIGLAVADEIVRLHGGALDIQSQEDVGTTVTISLPTCSHLEADPQLTETPELLKFIQERNL